MIYYVYILECRSGRLYTGITTDMKRRYEEHLNGEKGAKFTRSDPPEKLMALWSCKGRSDASRLEWAIKKLTRKLKLRLITEENDVCQIFGEDFSGKYRRENIQIF